MFHFDSILRGEPGFGGFALCVALLALVAFVDFATGYELNVSILYLAPVFTTTWLFGSQAGILVSGLAALSVVVTGQTFSHQAYQIWEVAIQFATFALFALVIAKLKTAISHADERFATVLEGLEVAVYVLDLETGESRYANEPFRELFPGGRRPPALPPDHRLGEVHDAESGRWFLVHVRPLRWIDGRMARLHIATDITERRRAEVLHLQQQEKLSLTARLVAVGEMATTLAHELNQPLAAIANYSMGCVRRLRSGDWEERGLLEAMEKSAAQAERASSVIQRLREFVARRQPRLVPCDINEVVQDVRSSIELEAAKHSVRVVLDLSGSIPYVRADQTLMEQVVFNLARNGIDAMIDVSPDERVLRIRSRAGAEETIEVDIEDRGRGVDPDLEANLFQPFFSTKPQGMGLGLHISRSIVEAHGGHLWITRNAERGATFHFSLQSVFAWSAQRRTG